MEGWLYGLFALLGVLIGGLFTYLGLRSQLKQQKEINEIEWRRKVRSEPLFSLRDELAKMATKLHALVKNTQLTSNQSAITENEQQQALDGWRDYITSGVFLPILYKQFDKELMSLVENIESEYMLLFEYALEYKNLKIDELRSFREISQSVKNKIIQVQEHINKKLLEL